MYSPPYMYMAEDNISWNTMSTNSYRDILFGNEPVLYLLVTDNSENGRGKRDLRIRTV